MSHRWNHQNYAVAPERLQPIEECIDALFPWVKFVAKPHLLGYRLTADMHAGAVYFRPTEAAGAVQGALRRLAKEDAALATALAALERIDADFADHSGVMLTSVTEWEECVARARRLERERPDFEIRVVDVIRPGDERAPTDTLYQAFIRIGLLGPLRNTVELQALSERGSVDLVRRFWDDLYAHRFDKLGAYFTADAVYDDVPMPEARVVGPAAIVRKLEIGLARVPRHVHHVHRVVAHEATVVTEHTEDWCFAEDHVVALPFVSVQEIDGGRIKRWSDYSNIATLLSAAPSWWLEHVTAEWSRLPPGSS